MVGRQGVEGGEVSELNYSIGFAVRNPSPNPFESLVRQARVYVHVRDNTYPYGALETERFSFPLTFLMRDFGDAFFYTAIFRRIKEWR